MLPDVLEENQASSRFSNETKEKVALDVAIASKDPGGALLNSTRPLRPEGTVQAARDTGDDDVSLSDGNIYCAVVEHGGSDAPPLDPISRRISAASTISGSWSTVEFITELEAAELPAREERSSSDATCWSDREHRMDPSSGLGCISTFVRRARRGRATPQLN